MDNVDNRTQTRPPCGEEEAAPPPFFCPVCSVRPFVERITRPVLFVQQEAKARKPQHSTPRGCSVQTPPDMAAPRIEAIRYENNRPRPTNRERPKRRRERRGCSVHTARPNIDNVDNMDTTARRVETTQARGGEYRKSKRPPPTNRERPKPQIKNERPKEQRARLCTNIQHEAKRNNRHALRLYGASRQEPKRYAPAYSPASSS